MKYNLILILIITALAPVFSYADGYAVELIEKPLTDLEKKTKALEDVKKRNSRNFPGYIEAFGGITFGDPVEKLGDGRTCKTLPESGENPDGESGELLACRVKKEYGKMEEIPVYDIEYLFQKIDDRYLMTGVNIFLYKSEEYFYTQINGIAPTPSDEPQQLSSAPKINYLKNQRCKSIASALSDAWGLAEAGNTEPKWNDKNHNISAWLGGLACNVVKMGIIHEEAVSAP